MGAGADGVPRAHRPSAAGCATPCGAALAPATAAPSACSARAATTWRRRSPTGTRSTTARTLPAVERYRGVVWEALAPATLVAGRAAAAEAAGAGALRPVGPARRAGRRPAVPARHGRQPARPRQAVVVVAPAVTRRSRAARARGWVIDLLPVEHAAALDPAGLGRARLMRVEIVEEGEGGTRAIGHAGKSLKGRLARAILEARRPHARRGRRARGARPAARSPCAPRAAASRAWRSRPTGRRLAPMGMRRTARPVVGALALGLVVCGAAQAAIPASGVVQESAGPAGVTIGTPAAAAIARWHLVCAGRPTEPVPPLLQLAAPRDELGGDRRRRAGPGPRLGRGRVAHAAGRRPRVADRRGEGGVRARPSRSARRRSGPT